MPVLPHIKARALAVDQQKGYLVKQVKPDVYVITDGIYQSAFVTTGKGVILFDAPDSFAQHIAGAGLLVKQVPKLTIVAEEGTAAFLREKSDPRRPLPTSTFKNQRTLKLGTMTVELKKGQWHSTATSNCLSNAVLQYIQPLHCHGLWRCAGQPPWATKRGVHERHLTGLRNRKIGLPGS